MPNSLYTVEDICAEIKKAHKEECHRGQSWEYCYAFFRNYKKFRTNRELLDVAALHLGFFLASWGMLRGSSFLLQTNYKYYTYIVQTLINQKYDVLWNADYLNAGRQEECVGLLFELKQELRHVMRDKNSFNHKEPTDTLITKIIMATMGCVPAYDRYFKTGLKIFLEGRGGKISPSFNRKSFDKLLNFSKEDATLRKIYEVSVPIVVTGIKYTPMKLLDLYFWRIGASASWRNQLACSNSIPALEPPLIPRH